MRVELAYDSETNTLTIADNAHGMAMHELTRDVMLDWPPPNPTGRFEYGMWLKTDACWFGTTWTIRTNKLSSNRGYTARVHLPELVDSHLESIAVEVGTAEPETHYTSITIEGLYKPIWGRTQGRVKDQLGSMYREDLRSSEIEMDAWPVTQAKDAFDWSGGLEDDSGLSLRQLIDSRRSALRGTPDYLKLERAVRQAGMESSTGSGPVIDAAEAEENLAWLHSMDIPHFRVPEPAGVTETRNKVALSTAPLVTAMEHDQWLCSCSPNLLRIAPNR